MDAEAKALIIWSPDVNSQLTGKDPDAGEDWGQEEKWVTEDETVGWHHQLNGHGIEQTPENSEGQGSLVCCSPWGHKEEDTAEQLNNNSSIYSLQESWGQLGWISFGLWYYSSASLPQHIQVQLVYWASQENNVFWYVSCLLNTEARKSNKHRVENSWCYKIQLDILWTSFWLSFMIQLTCSRLCIFLVLSFL